MGDPEKVGPDGLTPTERNLYISAQQAVHDLNDHLGDRGSAQQFSVDSSEDSAGKRSGA